MRKSKKKLTNLGPIPTKRRNNFVTLRFILLTLRFRKLKRRVIFLASNKIFQKTYDKRFVILIMKPNSTSQQNAITFESKEHLQRSTKQSKK